jgi:biopolymer transport protein ExbB
MYALAFVALVALLFAIDRILGLRKGRIVPHGLADQANTLWKKGDYPGLIKLAESSQSSLGRVIKFIVEHRSNAYAEITSGAEDIAARDFELHTRRNYPLVAVGTIAPLLGLMGTIFGLMGAFASIGVYGSMDNPAVLAKDIGEAMVTTATGLIIAVPALGLYHYFRTRSGELASILGEEASNLMHAWFLKKEEK